MIFLEVGGKQFEGWTKISVVRSVRSLSGAFSLSATSHEKVSLPVRKGDACRIFIDANIVINGFMETVDVSYDADEHTIGISGRDKTGDAIDSSAIIKELSGTLTLEKVIRRVLDGNGLTDIEVISDVTTDPFKTGDIESAEVGETVFEFIEKYARKRQVLLTGDGNGNIVITRSGTVNAVTALVNVVGGTNNNIKSAIVSHADTDLFNQYIVRSQLNPAGLSAAGVISPSALVNQSGVATDGSVRATRILEIRPDQSLSKDDSDLFALWHRNVRKSKAFHYTAVVRDHYQDEEQTRLWIPNEIVSVNDDFGGVNEPVNAKLLLDLVEYRQDLEEGSTTSLTLIDKNAYTLQAEQDVRDARANSLGI